MPWQQGMLYSILELDTIAPAEDEERGAHLMEHVRLSVCSWQTDTRSSQHMCVFTGSPLFAVFAMFAMFAVRVHA